MTNHRSAAAAAEAECVADGGRHTAPGALLCGGPGGAPRRHGERAAQVARGAGHDDLASGPGVPEGVPVVQRHVLLPEGGLRVR